MTKVKLKCTIIIIITKIPASTISYNWAKNSSDALGWRNWFYFQILYH